jgi:phosphatidylserine/phosphatidylglycerophosphate/cardiolipin synthase-like enzyme
VRVLVWAGAPLPLFRPSRPQVREAAARLRRGRVRVALDAQERPLHCHHEKLVLVDDRVAFVGGIDLTDFAGRRLDTSEHPARGVLGWHDACARIEGPAVADVAVHFALRWQEVAREPLHQPGAPAPAGTTEVQVVRTVPEHVYDALPHGEFSILEAYLRALRSAERLIYLENQFLWSPEIVDTLAGKLRRPPCDEFRIVCVLPQRPNDGADDTRGQLGQLLEADGGAGRVLACCLHQRGERGRPVYVHAKIGIVDDRWLTVGSANLNEHSLFNDTELNVVVQDPELARAARLRLWREHLERDDVEDDAAELVDTVWRPLAEEQLRRRESGEPLEHRLVRLPRVSKRSRRLLGPLQGLLVDG